MRVLQRSNQEVGVEDGQMFSFDKNLSEAMASGVGLVERIHANTDRLKIIRRQLGAQTVSLSESVIKGADRVLKTDVLDDIDLDDDKHLPETISLFDSLTTDMDPHDRALGEAIVDTGFLSLMVAAEKAIVDKTNETWKEEHLPGLIGKKVMLWVPSSWHHIGDHYWRYQAKYQAGGGNGYSSGSIGSGHAIVGEVVDLSLDEYGALLLKDGAMAYNRASAGNRAPNVPNRKKADPWDRFNWFEADTIFEHHKKDSTRLMPRIKVEEV